MIVAVGGDLLIPGGRRMRPRRFPIVMVGAGLILSRQALLKPLPGGNITGVTNLGAELGGKRLELFKEAVPKLARVAVLYDPANPPNVREVKEILPVAARALRLTIQPWEVRSSDEFDRVFAALSNGARNVSST